MRLATPCWARSTKQMIGLTLDEIGEIPERICVAGGTEKVQAIRSVLRGEYATILVTDEPTARALVDAKD
jgi:DNA-binding transcriptional regulator LsrR (DeoR family)